MKRIPCKSTIYCASRNGTVNMCITLDDRFENEDTSDERKDIIEKLNTFGTVTDYSWDPTNIGLDSPVDKALELIELYKHDKVPYISEIFVPRTKIRPCHSP
jgi:hypothetical protein